MLDSIEDVKALFDFLSHRFSEALPSGVSLDMKRIAVGGFSAGGYYARVACVYGEPKPAALMSAYGLGGDLLLDHWTAAQPLPSLARSLDLSRAPELLADRSVKSESAGRFVLAVKWMIEGTPLDSWFGYPGLGKRLNAVEYEKRVDAIPPELRPGFLQLFVGKDYPPSIFVHGLKDDCVSPEESKRQHEQLKKLGVRSELVLVEGAGHELKDFDTSLPPVPVEAADRTYQRAFEFIAERFEAVH